VVEREQPLIGQGGEELDDEERIAVGLLEDERPFSLVATGSNEPKLSGSILRSVLLVKSSARKIGLLARQDGLRIVQAPVSGYVSFLPGVPDQIIDITASHPYFTQDFCQRLVSLLNDLQVRLVTAAHVSTVLERVLLDPPPPLDFSWESLSDVGKAVAAAMAHALTDSSATVSRDAIAQAMPESMRKVLAKTRARFRQKFHRALTTLTDEWVESSQHGFRFRSELVRLWIRREHPVSQVTTLLLAGAHDL
jgi:hypothetical protein